MELYSEWHRTNKGTRADYESWLRKQADKPKISKRLLTVLFEYATATDAEITERGLADLNEILPEVRRILGVPDPDPDPDPDPGEETETCEGCGADLADDEGEGYDGFCGSCADAEEKKGRWS